MHVLFRCKYVPMTTVTAMKSSGSHQREMLLLSKLDSLYHLSLSLSLSLREICQYQACSHDKLSN